MSLGEAFLTLYALLVGVGLVVLLLAPEERMHMPVYVVSALIIALAALIVVGFSWLILAAQNPSRTVPADEASPPVHAL